MIGDANNFIAGALSSGLNPTGSLPASIGGGSASGGKGKDDDSFSFVDKALLLVAPFLALGITRLFRGRRTGGVGPHGPDGPFTDDHKDKPVEERLKKARALRLDVMRINKAVKGLGGDAKEAKLREAFDKCQEIKRWVTTTTRFGKPVVIKGGKSYATFVDEQLQKFREQGLDAQFELESLQRRLADTRQRLQTADADRAEALREQAETMQLQVNGLTADLETAQTEHEGALRQQKETARQDLKAAKAEREEALRQQKESAQQQVAGVTAELGTARQELGDVQGQFTTEQANHAETQGQLTLARQEIERERGSSAAMESMSDQALKDKEAAEAALSEARNGLLSVENERDGLQNQLAEEKDKHERQIEEKAEELARAQDAVGEALGKFMGVEAELKTAQASLTTAESQRGAFQQQLGSAQQELATQTAEAARLQRVLSAAQTMPPVGASAPEPTPPPQPTPTPPPQPTPTPPPEPPTPPPSGRQIFSTTMNEKLKELAGGDQGPNAMSLMLWEAVAADMGEPDYRSLPNEDRHDEQRRTAAFDAVAGRLGFEGDMRGHDLFNRYMSGHENADTLFTFTDMMSRMRLLSRSLSDDGEPDVRVSALALAVWARSRARMGVEAGIPGDMWTPTYQLDLARGIFGALGRVGAQQLYTDAYFYHEVASMFKPEHAEREGMAYALAALHLRTLATVRMLGHVGQSNDGFSATDHDTQNWLSTMEVAAQEGLAQLNVADQGDCSAEARKPLPKKPDPGAQPLPGQRMRPPKTPPSVPKVPDVPSDYGTPECFDAMMRELSAHATLDPNDLFGNVQSDRETAVRFAAMEHPESSVLQAISYLDHRSYIGASALLSVDPTAGFDPQDAGTNAMLVAVRDDAMISLQSRGDLLPDLSSLSGDDIPFLDDEDIEEMEGGQSAVSGSIAGGIPHAPRVRALIEGMLAEMWDPDVAGRMHFNALLSAILATGFDANLEAMLKVFNGAQHRSDPIDGTRMTKILDEGVSVKPTEAYRIATALGELAGTNTAVTNDSAQYVMMSAMLPYGVDRLKTDKLSLTRNALQGVIFGGTKLSGAASTMWTWRVLSRVPAGFLKG